MLRVSDVVGIPMHMPENEPTDAQILNWVLNLQTNYILGFLTTPGGWSGSAHVIMWQNIERITRHMINIKITPPIIDIGKIMTIKRILERPDPIIGLDVITKHNEFLGTVQDLYFDEHSGELIGLESCHNWNGKQYQFIPIIEPLIIDDDMIIIASDISTSEQLPLLDESQFDGVITLNAPPLDDLIGHRIDHDIRDVDDYIIIPRGHVITPEIAHAFENL